jgi:N-acetylglucosamine kinase-like BadF-type ATPase
MRRVVEYYLGIDAGGTHTRALLADGAGDVLARADGGGANYQSIGADAARAVLADVAARALDAAGARPADVRGACFGVAGADRPKDFAVVTSLLPPVGSAGTHRLVNDTHVALRAGTSDGVGVAVVSGTGTNVLGCAPDGRLARVGGLCYELGDFGSAPDLGRCALRLAMRGHDGRGAPTSLYERLCTWLQVEALEDVIDLWLSREPRATDFGGLAPLVFAAAADGDGVARNLLRCAGWHLAQSARIVLARLFTSEDNVTLVLAGSVLTRGTDPTLVEALARGVRRTWPGVRVVRLCAEPVVGAVLLARDDAGGAGAAFEARLRAATAGPFVEEVAP